MHMQVCRINGKYNTILCTHTNASNYILLIINFILSKFDKKQPIGQIMQCH